MITGHSEARTELDLLERVVDSEREHRPELSLAPDRASASRDTASSCAAPYGGSGTGPPSKPHNETKNRESPWEPRNGEQS